MRQAWMRRGKLAAEWIGVGVCVLAAAAKGQAVEPLRVEREPGAESCPDAAELETDVERIRGLGPTASSSYFVQFARAGRNWSAVLRSGADGSSLRNLESPALDCSALAQATAVTLALLFDADDARPPAEPAPSETEARPAAPVPQPSAAEPPPRKPSPTEQRLELSVGAGLVEGVLRPWAPVLVAELAYVPGDLHFGLGASWVPSHDSQLGPGTIELGLVAASARICSTAFRRSWLQLDACSGFTLGAISAAARGYTRQNQDKHPAFAALPLEAAFGQSSARASWQLSATLLIPFTRSRFAIDGLGPVYETPAIAASFALRVASWIDL